MPFSEELRETRASAWLTLDEDSTIDCRVDDADSADLMISGSMELSLTMHPDLMRECVNVLGEALKSMRRPETPR